MMCTQLFFMVTGVIIQHPVDTQGSLAAPPRVELVSGLVRQDNFGPRRRFSARMVEEL